MRKEEKNQFKVKIPKKNCAFFFRKSIFVLFKLLIFLLEKNVSEKQKLLFFQKFK